MFYLGIGPVLAMVVGISFPSRAGRVLPAGRVVDNAAAATPFGGTMAPDAVSPVTRYKRTPIYGYVEYNSATCAEISPGAWTLETPAPKYGKVTFGQLSIKQPSGAACPGKTFTYAFVFYEWEEHNNKALEDKVTARWKTPDKKFNVQVVLTPSVPVVRPASETTSFAAWDSKGLGEWRQTLHPPADDPTFDFQYDEVRETNPGGGGPDTCWFKGSAILPFTSITGGTWHPSSKNIWEYDHVGWYTTSISYYRKHKREPCGTHFRQQMEHQALAKPGYVKYGKVNELGGSFTKTTVTSIRAGSSKTETR